MNYTDSVPLTLEKKREKILTFLGKTKTFLIGKGLKTKDLRHGFGNSSGLVERGRPTIPRARSGWNGRRPCQASIPDPSSPPPVDQHL